MTLLGPLLEEVLVGLVEGFLCLVVVLRHVDQHDHPRAAAGRANQRPAELAAGDTTQVIDREADLLVVREPFIFQLLAQVLGERLHHRIFEQLVKLRLFPVRGELGSVSDREECLRRVRIQRLGRRNRRCDDAQMRRTSNRLAAITDIAVPNEHRSTSSLNSAPMIARGRLAAVHTRVKGSGFYRLGNFRASTSIAQSGRT